MLAINRTNEKGERWLGPGQALLAANKAQAAARKVVQGVIKAP